MAARLVLTLLVLATFGSLRAQAQDAPPTRAGPDFTSPLITTDPATGRPPAQESITAMENAVLATHDAFVAAIEDLAFDRIAALVVFTNRGALIADGRVTLSSDEMTAILRREFAPLTGVHHTFTRRHVSLLSPTTAMIVAEGTVSARTREGGSFEQPIAQTLVFMRVDDRWKLAHVHTSTPPARLGE